MDSILGMLMEGAAALGPISNIMWSRFLSGYALEIINLDPKVKELWTTICVVHDAAAGSNPHAAVPIRELLSDCLYNGDEPAHVFASLVWLHQAGLVSISVEEGLVSAHCWDTCGDPGSIIYLNGSLGEVVPAIWAADVEALRQRAAGRRASSVIPNGAKPWKTHPVVAPRSRGLGGKKLWL